MKLSISKVLLKSKFILNLAGGRQSNSLTFETDKPVSVKHGYYRVFLCAVTTGSFRFDQSDVDLRLISLGTVIGD